MVVGEWWCEFVENGVVGNYKRMFGSGVGLSGWVGVIWILFFCFGMICSSWFCRCCSCCICNL